MKIVMELIVKQTKKIDLDEWAIKPTDDIGGVKRYDEFLSANIMATQIDKELYEELITMLAGTASRTHLELKVHKFGLEAWTSLCASNDP